MPKENFDNWTKLEEVSEKIMEWVLNIDKRPKTGSFIKIETNNSITTFNNI
jgi:hypothetical protein